MKRIFWICIAICVLHSCKETQEGYVIEGHAEGIDGKMVLLQQIRDHRPVVTDSCVVKDGKFEMKGSVECPDYAMLYINYKGPVEFFIENKNIRVNVNMNDIAKSKVSGSEETDLFYSLSAELEELGRKIKQLNDDYALLQMSEVKDVEKEKAIVAQMSKIPDEQAQIAMNFIPKHPNKVVSAFIAVNMLPTLAHKNQLGPLTQLADSYDEVNANSQWVVRLKEIIDMSQKIGEGMPFTDLSMPSPDGQTISISDYAGKGKYVLLDFWAAWCRPCRMANPEIVKIYRKYKDKGFEIVGISLDRNQKDWTDAIAADRLTWPQMSDLKFWDSKAAKTYFVNSIPYSVLLDKDGTILANGLHVQELEEKLESLLGN